MGLADLIGLSPGTPCDFGVCAPIGNNLVPAVAGAGALGEGICIFAEPCGLAELAVLGLGTVAVVYGPEIIHALGSAIDPYNQYLKDLKACTERYSAWPSERRVLQASGG